MNASVAPRSPVSMQDIVAAFSEVAVRCADRTAVVCGERSLSYAALNDASDRLARCLVDRGVTTGAFVAVDVQPGVDRLLAVLGVLKAGGAYVPLTLRQDAGRVDDRIACLDLRIAVTDHDAVPGDLEAVRIDLVQDDAATVALPSRHADLAAYVNFSSGTTGRPKAIVCADRGVVRLVRGQSYATFDESLAMLNAASFDFDAFTLEVWAPLLNGGMCVVLDAPILSTSALRTVVAQHGVNAAWITSALFNMLVDIDVDAFAGLEQLLVGGDIVSPAHVGKVYDRHPDIRIVNGYGATENTTFTACFPIPRDWIRERTLPIGTPIEGGEVHVLGANGRAVPVGQVGELVVSGEGLALGYHDDPAASASAFRSHVVDGSVTRCYHTGDSVSVGDDGLLYFHGRTDAQVKINGRRIELVGIEHIMRAHPAVRDAAAMSIRDAAGQRIVGMVVPEAGAPVDWHTALATFLAGRMAAHEVPAELVAIADLPVTVNGKLDRRQLEATYRGSRGAEPVANAPAAGRSREVTRLWAQLLSVDRVDDDTDFFASGGNPMLAMRMLGQVKAIFGTAVTFPALRAASTLRAFTALLARADQAQGDAEPAAAVPVDDTQLAAMRLAVADVWSRALGRDVAGDDADFLRLGGTSLTWLRVQSELAIRHSLHVDVAILIKHGKLLGKLATHLASIPLAAASIDMLDEAALPSMPRDEEPPSPPLVPDEPSARLAHMRRAIVSTWCRMLGVMRIESDGHFFRLGGNSLLCLKVQADLSRRYGVEIDLAGLLAHGELEVLASYASEHAIVRQGPRLHTDDVLEGAVALTREQRRLWFLHRLRPSSAYNIPLLFELFGDVDHDRLGSALRGLVERHPALRMRIVEGDDETLQVPDDAEAWTMAVEHLRTADLTGWLNGESEHVFDLERGMPLRVHLLCVVDGRRYLSFNVHHLFFDGHSLGIVAAELPLLYAGATLPKAGSEFTAVVHWQRSADYRRLADAAGSYWRKRLDGAPAEQGLLPDRRDARRLGTASVRHAVLPPSSVQRARERARELGVSEFTFWLGLFGVLLARMGSQDDVVVATPVAHRMRPEFLSVVGFFANTLPLRFDVDDEARFCDHLASLSATLTEGLAHQACPLETLHSAGGDAAPAWSHVLFSVYEYAIVDADEWQLHPRLMSNREPKYPLGVSLSSSGAETALVVEYDAGLYSDAFIGQFLNAFSVALDQVIAVPSMTTGDIVLADTATAVDADADFVSIVSLIAQVAAGPRADDVAIHGRRGPWRYASVWERAMGYVGALRAAGLTPGARVGVMLERRDELPVLLLALLASGAVYVPLDPAWPNARVQQILDDAAPDWLVLDDSADADAAVRRMATVIDLASLDTAAPTYTNVEPVTVNRDDLAYLIYTSGSTGRPKGVAIRHESLYWLHRWAARTYAPVDLENVLAATSICFDLSVFEIFVTWSLGGAITVAQNALDLIDDARAARATLVNTVPSLLEEVLRHGGLPANLRVLNLAGEALRPTLVEAIAQAAPGIRLYNLYGPSEDTTYSTAASIDLRGDARITIGQPIDGTVAHVLDPRGRPLPDGAPGELYLAGRGLAAGYFGRPDLTAERFVEDPYTGGRMYRTGDRVRRVENGELEYLGRMDQQCKIRGYRIELGEIEGVLASHASIRDACVVACDMGTSAARLVAFVTADAEAATDTAALRAWLATCLPTYMIPSRIDVIDAMPLTPSGKLDRVSLAVDAARDDATAPVAATAHERWFIEAFGEALQVPRVSLDDSFVALGGNSWQATLLLAGSKEEHGAAPSFGDLMNDGTPRSLAARLDEALARRADTESSILFI